MNTFTARKIAPSPPSSRPESDEAQRATGPAIHPYPHAIHLEKMAWPRQHHYRFFYTLTIPITVLGSHRKAQEGKRVSVGR
jgi:hypothetical protein